MAKQRFSADLQAAVDAEIGALQAQRAAAAAAPTPAPPTEEQPGAGAGARAQQPPVPEHSITDVYDEQPRSLIIEYPVFRRVGSGPIVVWLAVLLVLVIVCAVLVVTVVMKGGTLAAARWVSDVLFGPWTVLALLVLVVLLFVIVRRRRQVPTVADSSKIPTGPDAVKTLDQRLNRLEQLQTWMREDAELERLTDDCIGRRVRAVERRQRTLAIVSSIGSLVAGWLLSAVSAPAVLLKLIPH